MIEKTEKIGKEEEKEEGQLQKVQMFDMNISVRQSAKRK